MKRLWPFPGESPVVRARKMVLAYRHLAQQQRDAALTLANALRKADTRLLAFDSPATLETIKTALKALGDHDPVAELDKRFTDWGETFHAEQPKHYDLDDFVKASIAAQLIQVAPKTINTMRINGRVQGYWSDDLGSSGGYLYKVRDLYDAAATMPSRGWHRRRSTDTLNNDRRSDSK